MRELQFSLPRRTCAGLMFAMVLAAVGCGSGTNRAPTGQVAGKVTYKGQPLPAGDVNLYSKERGVGAIGKLESTGTFSISGPVEVGTYAVYVVPPSPGPPEPGKVAPKVTSNIPKKAQDAATSGLSVTVKEGKNDFTIDVLD